MRYVFSNANDSDEEEGRNHVTLSPSYVRNYFTPPNSLFDAELNEIQAARLRKFQEESRRSNELISSFFKRNGSNSKFESMSKRRSNFIHERDRILYENMLKLKESYVKKEEDEFYENFKTMDHQISKDIQQAKFKADAERAQAEEKARKEKEAREKEELKRRKEEEERRRKEMDRKNAEERMKANQANKNLIVSNLAINPQNVLNMASSSTSINASINQKVKPSPRVSENALKEEKNRLEIYEKVMKEISPYFNNPALMKEKKTLQRKFVVHLQQVSFSQRQIMIKIKEISQMFVQSNHPPSLLAFIFVEKLLSQFESEIQNFSFVFSMAHVVVSLANQFPIIMDVLFGKLNQVCPFSVPKYFVYSKNHFVSEDEYYDLSCYRKKDVNNNNNNNGDGNKWEASNDYIVRMSANISLFAAIIQTDNFCESNGASGIAKGWKWISAFLNKMPPNKFTASALYSFLKVAGFRLYQVYPAPFLKLLQIIHESFLEGLKKAGEEDSKPVLSRLETYISGQQYKEVPEGRDVPVADASSHYRA